MQTIETLKVHRLIAASVLAIGLALMTMMILVESEPGLIPLVLVVLGGAWFFVTYARIRSQRRSS